MQRVILDTGALVALLDRKDQHHPWAAEAFRSVGVPMATCDAVLSETWFSLNWLPPSLEVLHRWIRRGWLVNRFDFETMGNRAFDLMARYRDLPMSYADACLVIIAEELEAHPIFNSFPSSSLGTRLSPKLCFATLAECAAATMLASRIADTSSPPPWSNGCPYSSHRRAATSSCDHSTACPERRRTGLP